MRRRKSRYTWFPVNPTFIGAEGTYPWSWYNGSLDITANFGVGPTPVATPLLLDQDLQAGKATQSAVSLRDRVEGKDYAVERVVGKVWGALSQYTADQEGEFTAQQVILAMGLAILPVNDDDDQPALQPEDYDPLNANNASAPWMWRRTWVLYNNLAAPEVTFTGPTNIESFGSMSDGPHLDCKSVRRVRREQRLYHVVSACTIGIFNNGSSTVPIQQEISWGYELRVLGAMRKARNESTFK